MKVDLIRVASLLLTLTLSFGGAALAAEQFAEHTPTRMQDDPSGMEPTNTSSTAATEPTPPTAETPTAAESPMTDAVNAAQSEAARLEEQAQETAADAQEAAQEVAQDIGEQQPLKEATGRIARVDTENRRLEVKKGPLPLLKSRFAIDWRTAVIGEDGKRLGIRDLKAGDVVKVEYAKMDGRNVARSVTVQMAGSAAGR